MSDEMRCAYCGGDIKLTSYMTDGEYGARYHGWKCDSCFVGIDNIKHSRAEAEAHARKRADQRLVTNFCQACADRANADGLGERLDAFFDKHLGMTIGKHVAGRWCIYTRDGHEFVVFDTIEATITAAEKALEEK